MLSNAVTNIDSVTTYKQYVKRAKECGMTALAFTEHGNIFEWVHKKIAIEEAGMKYIHGMEAYLTEKLPAEGEEKIRDNYHCVLLAKNYEGVKELNRLASRAFNRNDGHYYYAPRITFDELFTTSDNIIVNTACFAKGNLVLTKDGEKPIEEISSKDYVKNMYGEWERVNFPTRIMYSGNEVSISVKGDYRKIYCTEDHKFLVRSTNNKTPRWMMAKDFNTIKGSGSKSNLLYPIKTYFTNDLIIKKSEWLNSCNNKKYVSSKYTLPEEFVITPEFMRFIGLFIGDGYISLKGTPRIGVVSSDKEFDIYYDSFINPVEQQLGFKFNIFRRPELHRVDITTFNTEVVDLFYWLFGDVKANSKKIPDRLVNISEELNKEIIFGYLLSDGHVRNTPVGKYNSARATIVSVSEKLIRQTFDILRSLGISTYILQREEMTDKNGVHHQKAFSIDFCSKYIETDIKKRGYSHEEVVRMFLNIKNDNKKLVCENGVEYLVVNIQSVKSNFVEKEVYCLNNNTHSFVCGGVIVHNCVASALGRGTDEAKAKFIEFLKNNKHRCFMEVQHHNTEKQCVYNQYLAGLSKEIDVPLVAATDTHCLNDEHAMGRVALQNGKGVYFDGEEGWDLTWKTYEELIEAFKKQGALSEEQYMSAIQNTNVIADMIEPFELDRSFKFPKIYDNGEEILRNKLFDEKVIQSIVDEGVNPKQNPDEKPVYKYTRQDVIDRLNTEMETFKAIDSVDYILLEDYIIRYAHEHDMWQGPARGSAASSLALYALGTTEVNPLKYGFYFWRFMDKAKYSLPD